MKKLIFFLVFLAIAFFLVGTCNAYAQGYFKLNTNPQNPEMQPDPYKEYGIVLSEDSPIIPIGSGSGKKSKGKLPAGTLVIVDRESELASWVGICGNIIYTEWKPKGKKVEFKSWDNPDGENYRELCEKVLVSLKNLEANTGEIKQDTEKIKKSLGELKAMIRLQTEGIIEEIRINSSVSEGDWTTSKTFTTALATIGGAVISGYAFQKESIKTIDPFGSQTGNGTIMWGPVETKIEKKFNTEAAIIGGLVSGGVTYLLNKTVF